MAIFQILWQICLYYYWLGLACTIILTCLHNHIHMKICMAPCAITNEDCDCIVSDHTLPLVWYAVLIFSQWAAVNWQEKMAIHLLWEHTARVLKAIKIECNYRYERSIAGVKTQPAICESESFIWWDTKSIIGAGKVAEKALDVAAYKYTHPTAEWHGTWAVCWGQTDSGWIFWPNKVHMKDSMSMLSHCLIPDEAS